MNAGSEDLFQDHQRALDVNNIKYLKTTFHCVFRAHLLGVAWSSLLFLLQCSLQYNYPH